MKKNSIICAITLACAVFLSGHTPALAAAWPQYTIGQGDRVVIEGNSCTVGYVDEVKRKAYIADHCAPTGKKVAVSDEYMGRIGEITSSYDWDHQHAARYDVGVIDIYNSVKITGNSYSGDKRARNLDVQRGDKICMYSRMQNKVKCGSVRIVDGNIVAADEGASGEMGDSGGPAWVPGKGFVGVYSMFIGKNYSNLFTSIDEDVTCAKGKHYYWDTPEDDRVRISDHDCPREQLANYSPDVIERKNLQDPHPILIVENGKYIPADHRFGGREYDPETMRPGSPTVKNPHDSSDNNSSSTNNIGAWLGVLAALAGMIVAFAPIIQSLMIQ